MSEVAERHRIVADGFTARVAGVAPDDWSVTTPCSEWTVAFTPLDQGLRRAGGFAAQIVPPFGADVQTQLLNFCARST
jgi:hypothetical protein